MGSRLVAWFLILHLTKVVMAAPDIQVTPKLALVNPGEEVSILCKMNTKLEVCLFKFPGGEGISLKTDREFQGVKYVGKGLDAGDCGALIQRVEEKHHGLINCSLISESDGVERMGSMRLVVAIPPKQPNLQVSVGMGTGSGSQAYKEKDQLTATCTVRDGRPAANISWYLGDELITDGLQTPNITCVQQKKELCTVQQTLTRTLQATDDKKVLKCVSSHYSFKDSPQEAISQISVAYPPKPSYQAFEYFGLVEGAVGRVPIVIEANPQPRIFWSIGGDLVYENTNNGRYTVEPTVTKGPGQYESVLLIDTLTKEDMTKEYRVTAHNDLGEEEYTVSISTSPGPKVLEMGAGLIIIIVVCIILVLVILGGVFYARAKGKLCFAGAEGPKIAGESSDTESADHTTDRRPRLDFVSVFRKKRDKVAADQEMLKGEIAEQALDSKDPAESVVYAELDLAAHPVGPAVVVRGDDDKTEYAEIIHAKAHN